MKNLLLNVVRSFKKNKISIIGLIFLLFFGLGVFVVMSNTTANITNEYTSLASEGKLHDFTASELYDTGNASFAPYTKGVVYEAKNTSTEAPEYTFKAKVDDYSLYTSTHITTTALISSQGYAKQDGTFYVALPEQTRYTQGDDITFVRTYHIVLDELTSTGLYQKFAHTEVPKKSRLVDFTIRTSNHYTNPLDVPEELETYQTMVNGWTTLTSEDCITLAGINIFHYDYDNFIKSLNDQSQTIFNVMTTTQTPLANKLETTYANQLDYRFFKSVNVTATDDNIFYKVINSNPSDNIDKMVLFKDTGKRTGNHLFNNSDWAPYDSKIEFFDQSGVVLTPGDPVWPTPSLSFNVPVDYSDVATIPLYSFDEQRNWKEEAKYVYSQIMHIRFKRMLSANITTDSVKPYLKNLAAKGMDRNQYFIDFYNPSTLNSTYINYLYDWYNGAGESITISTNGNVVFSWVEIAGTPQTCTVSNWTSRFSIINPQHLEKNGKRVIDPSVINNFAPFKEWFKATYGSYPDGEINQTIAQNWFNNLTQDQFNFWVNPYVDSDWVTMNYEIPGWDNPLVVARGANVGQWNGIDKTYTVDCGGFNQIIWGCGLTPDFMYPVVDISRPTPNTKTECLVYCNESGYNAIKLAFINASVEEYIVGKFKSNVSETDKQSILNAINDWAKDNMILPKNVKSAYFANDTNNLLNCSGFRVAYIPNLVSVINVVSTILCSFIGVLTLIICFVIIKRYVENNRVNIGIMRANGIKKSRIALSLLPFALLPAVVGGIGAYLAGLFLQAPALSLFSNYWMLPTPLISFSWLPFLCCIFIPFLIFSLICFITTLMVLRVSSVELMKSGSEFKTNSFSRIVKKPFKHFGVLTKFRVALAFNSISRLLMLAAMSCLTMSSLVFSFTTFDKLNQSRITNSTQFDYSFNVELTTPTSSGSIYSIYDYSENIDDNLVKGYGWSDPSQYVFNTSWDTTVHGSEPQPWWTEDKVTSYKELTKWYSHNTITSLFGNSYKNTIGGSGNLLLPTVADSTGQNIDLFYLNNKMCSKLTLDHNIGVPGIASSNPWEIALALMPANSRNIAASNFNTIINLAGQQIESANATFIEKARAEGLVVRDSGNILLSDQTGMTREEVIQHINNAASATGKWYYPAENSNIWYGTYWNNAFSLFVIKGEDGTYSLTTDILAITNLYIGFNNAFIQFIKNIYQDPEMMKYEYPITYGTVPLNWDKGDDVKKDELYTYITSTIDSLSSGKEFDKGHEIKIEGIIEDSEFIRLTNNNGEIINSWLFDQNYLNSLDVDEDVHPIIVNAYAAHKYRLNRGDTITINVTNTVDRFEQKIHPDQYTEDSNKATFKVVGVSQGTNNEAFYTTQKVANDILGLPNGESWNKTHKYLMWSTTEWTKSSLPKLADLAGINSDDGHISVYSFENDHEIIDKSVLKLTGVSTPVGFNGIYTQNKLGKPITAGMSLYSYTGMYPATSVFRAEGNNKVEDLLATNNNLSIANLMTGFKVPEIYQGNYDYLRGQITEDTYRNKYVKPFISRLVGIYGETTMITSLAGAMDVAASDLVYANLISTFDLAEATIMSIIIPITIIIVAIISNLIINDSKKMAAMLKALGYSDSKNLMSILALFIPTIVLGVALAIPLSIGLTLGYQAIIFNTANILVDVTQKWWYYVAAIGGIGTILIGTYAIGFASLKKNRLVDQIK